MLSFRVSDSDALRAREWATRLGVDRSQLLRDALRCHLAQLAAQDDIESWRAMPLTAEESTLASIADWGPAEDFSDWADAAR